MKHLLVTASLICITIGTRAQETPEPTGLGEVASTCLIETDDKVWQGMGLTEEQLAQVKDIQTKCKTDCAATPETGVEQAEVSGAILLRYKEQLRGVLTEEQFNYWDAFCDQRPAKM